MRVVRFSARLPAAQVDRLPVHQPATILVHLAARPGDVRGWTTFAEALPELAARTTADDLDRELSGRPMAVRPRLAYLLGGVAPAVADRLQPATPSSVTWFGSARTSPVTTSASTWPTGSSPSIPAPCKRPHEPRPSR